MVKTFWKELALTEQSDELIGPAFKRSTECWSILILLAVVYVYWFDWFYIAWPSEGLKTLPEQAQYVPETADQSDQHKRGALGFFYYSNVKFEVFQAGNPLINHEDSHDDNSGATDNVMKAHLVG